MLKLKQFKINDSLSLGIDELAAVKNFKDKKYSEQSFLVYQLCVDMNFYTNGGITDYEKMLANCDTWSIGAIAQDISKHSVKPDDKYAPAKTDITPKNIVKLIKERAAKQNITFKDTAINDMSDEEALALIRKSNSNANYEKTTIRYVGKAQNGGDKYVWGIPGGKYTYESVIKNGKVVYSSSSTLSLDSSDKNN